MWREAIFIRKEEIAPNTCHFWFETKDMASLNFRAGQFITFDLPISERRRERWRSYSVASAPDGGASFELGIVRNPVGRGTAYLFDSLQPGETLKFKGPDGVFFLPEKIENDLVFLCTGTGVAPFRSMLLDIFSKNIPHKKLHLVFGTRKEEQILYRTEFEDMAAKHPEFRYDIVLSQSPDWPGHRGYIHQVYKNHYADSRSDIRFYLCGWRNMIDEATLQLTQIQGYAPAQVISELYG